MWHKQTGELRILRSYGNYYFHPTEPTDSFISLVWPSSGGGTGWLPVPGRYDGDAWLDFAVWNTVTGEFKILYNYGPGTFFSGSSKDVSFNPPGIGDWTLVVGDYDGDGLTDIAAFNRGTGQFAGDFVYSRSSFQFPDYPGCAFSNCGVDYFAFDLSDLLSPPSNLTPLAGRFDEDIKSDLALWDKTYGLTRIIKSNAGSGFTAGFKGYAPGVTDHYYNFTFMSTQPDPSSAWYVPIAGTTTHSGMILALLPSWIPRTMLPGGLCMRTTTSIRTRSSVFRSSDQGDAAWLRVSHHRLTASDEIRGPGG